MQNNPSRILISCVRCGVAIQLKFKRFCHTDRDEILISAFFHFLYFGGLKLSLINDRVGDGPDIFFDIHLLFCLFVYCTKMGKMLVFMGVVCIIVHCLDETKKKTQSTIQFDIRIYALTLISLMRGGQSENWRFGWPTIHYYYYLNLMILALLLDCGWRITIRCIIHIYTWIMNSIYFCFHVHCLIEYYFIFRNNVTQYLTYPLSFIISWNRETNTIN